MEQMLILEIIISKLFFSMFVGKARKNALIF